MVVLYDVGTITVVDGNTRPSIRSTALDGITRDIGNIAVSEINTVIGHITALDGITLDRWSIKIFNIDTAIGIGQGVAADLQARGRATGVITV